MTTHKVKSWVGLFEPIYNGQKTHDLRDMVDRNYKVGDILLLQEYDQFAGKYTGREAKVKITYITSNVTPCALSSNALAKDHCILSISLVE